MRYRRAVLTILSASVLGAIAAELFTHDTRFTDLAILFFAALVIAALVVDE